MLVCNLFKATMQTANLIEGNITKQLLIPGFTGQYCYVARSLNIVITFLKISKQYTRLNKPLWLRKLSFTEEVDLN